MAQPQFGLAGADSLTNASRRDILELVDGINLQQFIRMARPSQAAQTTRVSAWGITPVSNNYWPESVSLTVAEEAVQHEIFNNVQPLPTGNGSVVYDASLVFRARATLSISGKCIAIPSDDPGPVSWPSDVESAIGGFIVGISLHPPNPGTNPVITTSAEYTKLRTEWHTFSVERQWIIQGAATGENILDDTDFTITPPAGTNYVVYQRTYNLSNEGFATQGLSAEYYPQL